MRCAKPGAPPGNKNGARAGAPCEAKPRSPIASDATRDAFHVKEGPEYIAAGFALVPIPAGQKGPSTKDWQEDRKCVHTVAQLGRIRGNVGLAHRWSGTCAIDIDDVERSRTWLAARGVDLDQLLAADDMVGISSGRPNRAKLLYRLPTPLRSKKVIEQVGGKPHSVIDFRCADANDTTLQDILPPSTHPDTGMPYRWTFGVAGHFSDLPPLPAALREVWLGLLEAPRTEPRERSEPPPELEELRALLDRHDPDCDRDTWVRLMAAVHYETEGSEEGLDLVDAWSSRGSKYAGREDVEGRWRSYRVDRDNPVTAASLRVEAVATPDDFDDVSEPAAASESAAVVSAPAAKAGKRERFELLSAEEFENQPSPTWIIRGVLPRAGLIVVYGPPGSGKSFFVQDMLGAISRGVAWRDLPTKKLRVVYIIAEGQAGAQLRMRAYRKARGPHSIAFMRDCPSFLDANQVLAAAKKIVAAGGADLIAVDTLARAIGGGNENSPEDMGQAIENCSNLQRATGATVLLVHHSGKDSGKGARGHSSLLGADDAEIYVSRVDDRLRVAEITKQKDGEDGQRFAFRLERVELGLGPEGEELVSCVVEHEEVAPVPQPKARKLNDTHRIVCDAIRGLSIVGSGDTVLLEAVIAAAAAQLPPPDAEQTDNRRRDVKRAVVGLQTRGFVMVEGAELRIFQLP